MIGSIDNFFFEFYLFCKYDCQINKINS
ncbi:unnamed protein product [Nezara viridula]|uniref:Uncharacterized protein n=1 Tax=Nezara viridula TaxID=85310 RepID=A0A9P0H3C0_NEZVI|nr:unnamed protein product [Nezara viridula]